MVQCVALNSSDTQCRHEHHNERAYQLEALQVLAGRQGTVLQCIQSQPSTQLYGIFPFAAAAHRERCRVPQRQCRLMTVAHNSLITT
jgi:hypothetical protein